MLGGVGNLPVLADRTGSSWVVDPVDLAVHIDKLSSAGVGHYIPRLYWVQ